MFLQVHGVLLLGDLEIGAGCHIINLRAPMLIVVANDTRGGVRRVFIMRFRSADWRGALVEEGLTAPTRTQQDL